MKQGKKQKEKGIKSLPSRKLLLLVIVILFVPISSYTADLKDVVINEIAWMGTQASTSDEWIELYNNTDQSINLDGWTLSAADEIPNISLSGFIGGNSLFILERTNDNTIQNITADLIYTGALEDDGEHLLLKDNLENIIDEINCESSWFAGDRISKSSMERKHPLIDGNNSSSWGTNNGVVRNGLDANNNEINGTPKFQNSVFDASLPVFLISFTATIVDNGILLRWCTASEVQNAGFYVCRCEQVAEKPVRISSLIPGAGNSTLPKEYQYLDEQVYSGRSYYYQLEDVDISGVVTQHAVIKVVFGKNESGEQQPKSWEISPSYPNPFGERLGKPLNILRFTVPREETVNDLRVSIFNLLGEEVLRFPVADLPAGEHQLEWDGLDHSGTRVGSGLYFWLVYCERVNEVRKVVLVR